MSIEVKIGDVFKDGEQVGSVVDGVFEPIDGLHHKTIKAVENYLAATDGNGNSEEKPSKASKSDPEPEKDPMKGDLTPEYIEWHRKNKSKEEHEARYEVGEARLVRAGLGRE